ncbi:hypothetical protein CAPN002_00290 [Capnocytophaga stomatis]|uniref:transcriptional regulator n=1 Tax=Capnocytophaga stomatis TaxID=1848904 RepID=UPI00194EB599|nr:transcriptional regulator [Capnocytophaga stomatis]GIJ92811.1 hypothetical protein CAPN002_00290 [Capnocytophaga stomatis]
MEYLDLIKKFWAINEESPFNNSISSVYLYLLECWDRNGGKDFELSDTLLSKNLKLTRKTVKSSKEILRNLGFISYQTTNGVPAFYKIMTDYTRKVPSIATKQGEEQKKLKKEKVEKPTEKSKKELKTTQEIIQEPTKEVVKEVIEKSVQVQDITEKTTQEKYKSEVPETQDAEKKDISIPPNIEIPSLEEFMEYAKSLDIYKEVMDFQIQSKYETWLSEGWKNGYGRIIKNWKSQLQNSMMFFRNNDEKKSIFNIRNIKDIPKINRPKSTYNE